MSQELLKSVEAKDNPNIPALFPGDQVSVHVKIQEGDRERIQEFKGTILRVGQAGNNKNFTVRRIASNGIGVERMFLTRSPRIDKVVVERSSDVKRANLSYLRGLTGKRGRLKQRFDDRRRGKPGEAPIEAMEAVEEMAPAEETPPAEDSEQAED